MQAQGCLGVSAPSLRSRSLSLSFLDEKVQAAVVKNTRSAPGS